MTVRSIRKDLEEALVPLNEVRDTLSKPIAARDLISFRAEASADLEAVAVRIMAAITELRTM